MTTEAATVVGGILGFLFSALIFLAYGLSRTRERLAKIEQWIEDMNRRES